MKTGIIKFSKAILVLVVLSVCTIANAQVKYDSNGKLTIGNTTPYEFYGITCWIITSENVTVTNGAKLTFNAGESVTIKTPFTVNTGSQIEIYTN